MVRRADQNCLDGLVPYITRAAMVIDARKDEINDLNIFPAPDGDTGTNLANTLAGVVFELSELARRNPNPIADEVYDTVTEAVTMHARGNSGVILAYIIHGAVGVLRKTKKRFSVATLKATLEAGKEAAYAGLGVEAKEGTILTVISEMAEAAGAAAKRKLSLAPALEMVVAAGFAAVDKTPEMIDQLMGGKFGKKDAGAHALALMAQGAYEQLIGKAMDMILSSPTSGSIDTVYDEIKWRDGDPLYHTQMLVKGADLNEVVIKAFLSSVGSSVLCMVGKGVANVHVHTDNPGAVLAEMIKYGELTGVEVDNMKAQAEEFHAKAATAEVPKGPPKDIGLVVVAAGEGMKYLLTDLGVDAVVDGGQTANPEVAELVGAIESVNAKSVIVCSSNANIVMAAREAAKIASKSSEVIPTNSVQESVAAAMAYNPESTLVRNIKIMSEAAGKVVSGAMTKAIAKSKTESGQAVKVGNYIGVSGKRVLAAGKDYLSTAQKLITLLMAETPKAEMVTIYVGESAISQESLADWIEKAWPEIDTVVVDGGQPVYDTLIAIE